MTLLAKEFYVAASRAKKRLLHVKKGEKIHYVDLFSKKTDKEELKKEIKEAEELFETVKGKVSKKKLNALQKKIDELKEQVHAPEEPVPEEVHHEGVTITPPQFDDLHAELDELDEQFGIPKKNMFEAEESFPEITLPEDPYDTHEEEHEHEHEVQEPVPLTPLLHLPPPPPRS